MKEEKKMKNNNNEATATETAPEVVTEEVNIFDATAPEQTEKEKSIIQKAREQALKAIRFNEIPYIQSKKLLGADFDIVNAIPKQIDNEANISFILKLNKDVAGFKKGDVISASKKRNTFTECYLDYFSLFGENETPEPMRGYTFVEEGAEKSGNKPVILRQL